MLRRKVFSAALAVLIGIGALSLAAARPAEASRKSSENMYRYLTYGLGGVTAYGAIRKNPTIALIGAAGTYLAYRKWKDEVRRRHHFQHARVRVRSVRRARR